MGVKITEVEAQGDPCAMAVPLGKAVCRSSEG